MILAQLRALWVLGTAFLSKLLVMPFVRGHDSARLWLDRLHAEGIERTPPDMWAQLEPASRCIGCGVCDAVGPVSQSPSHLVQSIDRQPADAKLVSAETSVLREHGEAIERVCPARVGVGAMVRRLEGNAQGQRSR